MEEVKKISCMKKAMPFILVILLQVGLAGMDILTKAVLNEGMSNYVLVVYRHGVAAIVMAPFAFYFDKVARPKMTPMIFFKITLLGLFEPVIDQNLFCLGMKYTTATFATALYNTLPAVTFILALIVRLEKVKLRSIRSASKVIGTMASVGGTMIMTLVKGPALDLFWTKGPSAQNTTGTDIHSSIKGAVLVTIGCFSYACFFILYAITLKTYPTELSLTAWICLMGTLEGAAVALVMERGNPGAWAIGWDNKLLTVTYSVRFTHIHYKKTRQLQGKTASQFRCKSLIARVLRETTFPRKSLVANENHSQNARKFATEIKEGAKSSS